MLKKILAYQIGQVTDEELNFAKQQMKNEKEMKGLEFSDKGERLNLLALYILFYRRHFT